MAESIDEGPIIVLSRPAPGKPLESVYLEVDAAESEQHTSRNTITDHPVERGVNITDHTRPEPEQVSAEIIVSNTPVSSRQQARKVQAGGFTFTTTAAGEVKIGAVDGAAAQAYQKLLKLKREGTLCKLVTSLRTYTSMMVESVTVPRTAKTADALACTVNWKEVVVVENKLTRTVISNDRRVGKKKKQGEKVTEDAGIPDSALKRGYDGAQGKEGTLGKVTGFLGGVAGL